MNLNVNDEDGWNTCVRIEKKEMVEGVSERDALM